MRIDIDAFNVLQVLVEEGSFAKAAERLHKAQSAVSYQVKKLEEHLGVQLFSRDQYRAELTSEGRVILAEGQRLLQHLANIEHLASRFSEGWEPKLELVIDGALPMEPISGAESSVVQILYCRSSGRSAASCAKACGNSRSIPSGERARAVEATPTPRRPSASPTCKARAPMAP